MSLPKFSTSNQIIDHLKVASDLERKANFLKPLLVGLIIIHFIILFTMFIAGSILSDYLIVSFSLTFNLVIGYLYQRRQFQLAAHLFCYSVNLLLFLYIPLNLFAGGDERGATSFSYSLALSVLLAGLLISPRATFGFAVLNTGLIFIPHLIFIGEVAGSIRHSLPSIGFLYLFATVSWLYQKTMNEAQAELNAAQQQLARTELMKHDLAIARELQLRLYPNPPETGLNFTIACRSEPSQETSGDFYDFIQLGSHEWGLVVGDVTGKSLPAAMVMAMARSTLRSESNHSISPSMLLRRANQVLCRDAAVDQMITVLYGVLNTETLTFHFANAGHIYPLLKTGQGAYELELNGFPLNATPQAQYQEKAIQLAPGDQLILSSDGIVEAMNFNREMFGFERLIATVCQADCATPAQTLQRIWQAVETYRGPLPQEDDITLVVIGVNHHVQTLTADEIDLDTQEMTDD